MIERRIDELGRIVIPKEMRSKLGIASGTPMQIDSINNEIVLRKSRDCCYLCGEKDDVDSEFHICSACMSKILKVAEFRKQSFNERIAK